jgi:Skp family chaperone for outer membrane proteins
VEAHETHELAEHLQHESGHGHPGPDWFRRITGIYLGVVAMLLAIASLGGSEATKEMLNSNIHASDTYAFYQSKYIRQIHYQTAAEELESLAAASPALTQERQAKLAALVKRYRDTAARYESEPASGEGKKELMAKAQQWEKKRDHAASEIPNFEYAEALYQIAIVLGSVSIVAASTWLLGLSGVLATGGLLLTLNGYLLLVPLPHGDAGHDTHPPASAANAPAH